MQIRFAVDGGIFAIRLLQTKQHCRLIPVIVVAGGSLGGVIVDLHRRRQAMDGLRMDVIGGRHRRVLAGPTELQPVVEEHERSVGRKRVKENVLFLFDREITGEMSEKIATQAKRVVAVTDAPDESRTVDFRRGVPCVFDILPGVEFQIGRGAARFQEEAELRRPRGGIASLAAAEIEEARPFLSGHLLRQKQHLASQAGGDFRQRQRFARGVG